MNYQLLISRLHAVRLSDHESNYSFKGNADVSDFQTSIRRRVPLTQALGPGEIHRHTQSSKICFAFEHRCCSRKYRRFPLGDWLWHGSVPSSCIGSLDAIGKSHVRDVR